MLSHFDPIFVWGNYVESGVWCSIGLLVALAGRSSTRLLLAGALFLFGISDIVEVETGAWYEPWWMLTWKTICVFALACLGTREFRAFRRSKKDPASPSDGRES